MIKGKFVAVPLWLWTTYFTLALLGSVNLFQAIGSVLLIALPFMFPSVVGTRKSKDEV